MFVSQTAEEYHEMMESDEVKEMKKLHMEFRQSLEHEFLNTQSCNVRLQIGLLGLFIAMNA